MYVLILLCAERPSCIISIGTPLQLQLFFSNNVCFTLPCVSVRVAPHTCYDLTKSAILAASSPFKVLQYDNASLKLCSSCNIRDQICEIVSDSPLVQDVCYTAPQNLFNLALENEYICGPLSSNNNLNFVHSFLSLRGNAGTMQAWTITYVMVCIAAFVAIVYSFRKYRYT